MLLAEELEADWTKFSVEFALAAEVYFTPDFGSQRAGGSSVRVAYTLLRQAGAAAREVLISAAANQWKVIDTPAERLDTPPTVDAPQPPNDQSRAL